jgi:hypothetical protein
MKGDSMKSYLEWTDDVATGDRIINMRLMKNELAMAQLDRFDHLLFDDIKNGEPSDTPIADQILGLETLVRKMELAAKAPTPPKDTL